MENTNTNLSEKNTDTITDVIVNSILNTSIKVDIIETWIEEFTKRIKGKSNSKKVKYTFEDALLSTTEHSPRDKCFILVYKYLKENPPERNAFIKYLTAYIEHGIKLKGKYFPFELEPLIKYYEKADQKKKEGCTYNPFSIKAYRSYVIFMVLKLQGQYEGTDNDLFNVTFTDDREYNPATKIPSILRGFLPIDVKEYDIKRAFPTFIDMELGADYRHTIYDILDKKTFAQVLNANSVDLDDDYYTKCIDKLKKVYGHRAYEVLTSDRFSEKGRAFRDFTKYEKEFVEQFIRENDDK